MLRRLRRLPRTWPKAAWRLRGYGDLMLAGRRVRFHDIDRWPYDEWALEARRGRWEPRTLARFAELVRPGDTVLDVGAHFGIYTLLASELVGPSGRVVAFEPDPVSRSQLERNVRGARASNVEVRPEAVADSHGGGRLTAGALGTGDTSLTGGEHGLQVPTVTLSAFCAEREVTPDVLKVDVEGGEAAVLGGASPDLLRGLRAVILEVHEPMLRERGIDPEAWLGRMSSEFAGVEQLDDREPGNRTVALVNDR
jgi:FkbM family methyltransferase